MTTSELKALEHDWKFWARPNQLPPPQPWTLWLILAGRGYGKTRTGAETVRSWATGKTPLASTPYKHIALIAETAADARDVMVEGESGILQIHPKAFRPVYEPSKRRLTWPNGNKATLFNATEPDQLRGPQFHAAWLDELAKWRYHQETWDMLQFGLRLGDHPIALATTTPKPIPLLKELISSRDTHVTRGSTYENRSNLARTFFTKIITRYEGSRLGRQEIDGELLDDVRNSFWPNSSFVYTQSVPRDLDKVVVAIDPSGISDEDTGANEVGIIVAASHGKTATIINDLSVEAGPATWGRVAVEAYHRYEADAIVAETNFGGDMVRHVIHSIDPTVKFVSVSASRGKVIRAEPVATLYEQHRVEHLGQFALLEDQLRHFTNEGYLGDGSPDRADALVWAITYLLLPGIGRATSKELRL